MKTIKFLSMAALALVGTMTVGCSSDDNFIEQTQQPVNSNNVVTLTATVGFDEAASNRALAIDYPNKKLTKTFEAGDQIAVIYENTIGTMVKETVTIAAGDISTDKKSATFTVSMTDPKASGTLKYIYPAAMAGATDVDYTKLASQDGTLASLAANLDLATFEGTLTAAKELPASASLTNKLAILALKIKNSDGTSDLTSGITGMTLSDGTNSYSITGKDTDGHIYAAIQATSGANISCFATTASGNYAKSLTGKTYAANNIYDLGLRMNAATPVTLGGVTVATTIQNGQTVSQRCKRGLFGYPYPHAVLCGLGSCHFSYAYGLHQRMIHLRVRAYKASHARRAGEQREGLRIGELSGRVEPRRRTVYGIIGGYVVDGDILSLSELFCEGFVSDCSPWYEHAVSRLDFRRIDDALHDARIDQEVLAELLAHAQAEAKEKNYGAPDGRLGQPFFDRGRRGAGGCLHGERCPIFLERGYNKLYVVFESDRRKGWTHVKVSKEIPSELVAEGYLLFVF